MQQKSFVFPKNLLSEVIQETTFNFEMRKISEKCITYKLISKLCAIIICLNLLKLKY